MSLEFNYDIDASPGPGLVSALALVLTFTVMSLAATIGLTHTSATRETVSANASSIREDSEERGLNPITPEQPRVVAYIVSSKREAVDLNTTMKFREALAYQDASYEPVHGRYSILVAETSEQAQAWMESFVMATWEGVLVEIHDLTLE